VLPPLDVSSIIRRSFEDRLESISPDNFYLRSRRGVLFFAVMSAPIRNLLHSSARPST